MRARANRNTARRADLLDAAEDDDGARRPSERLGLAAELVSIASPPPGAPAAALGAALDVGFVSRVGAIGGFAIHRV